MAPRRRARDTEHRARAAHSPRMPLEEPRMNTIRGSQSLLASIVVAAAALVAASCERSLAGAPCPCVSGYTCCANDQTCHPAGSSCTDPGDSDGGGPAPGSDAGGPLGPDGGPRTPTVFPHLCTADGWCGATPGFSSVWGTAPNDLWVLVSVAGDYPTISAPLHFDGKDWTAVSIQPRGGSIYGPPQLVTLWGSGASDVFAVGYYGGIVHFDGVRWSDQSIGDESDQSTQVYFRGVAGSGPDDVWAVGKQGGMAHFDGSVWSLYARAAADGPDLAAVWVHDRATAWAVGAAGLILRWDGASWSPVQDGFGGTPTTEDLTAIWGSGADDVWAVGKNGTVLHFDGSNWQSHSYDVSTHADLLAVHGRGREDVWAVGAGGVLLHWTGAAWYTAPTGTKEDLHGIWASAGGDIWAVGDTSASVHWDGAAWAASPPLPPTWGPDVVAPPPADMLPKDLYAVGGDGPNDVWVAGDAGAMLHFDGQQWRPDSVGGYGQSYRGIWGDGSGAFWFVGTGGVIAAAYDGRDPSRPYPPSAYSLPALAAIWGTAADDVWAVGAGGTIVHLDGKAWSVVPSPTTADITSIWGFAADDIWASTRGEGALHFDGTTWSAIQVVAVNSGTTLNWYAVFGIAPDDLWITGSYTYSGYMSGGGGPAWSHWDGSAWTVGDISRVPFATSGDGVWRSGPGSLWMVDGGTVQRLDGATITRTYTGASGSIRGIWGSSPDDLWAVGDKGTILHRKLGP
jgi:hypothetical protein